MKSLRIDLPTELQGNPFLLRKNVQIFVIDAIKEKIDRDVKSNLNDFLAEGYKASIEEDKNILNDFKAADFENLK